MSLVGHENSQRVCGHKCAAWRDLGARQRSKLLNTNQNEYKLETNWYTAQWRFQHNLCVCYAVTIPTTSSKRWLQRAVRLCCSPLPPEGAVATSLLLGSPAPKPLLSKGPTTGFSCQFSPNRFMAERERKTEKKRKKRSVNSADIWEKKGRQERKKRFEMQMQLCFIVRNYGIHEESTTI